MSPSEFSKLRVKLLWHCEMPISVRLLTVNDLKTFRAETHENFPRWLLKRHVIAVFVTQLLSGLEFDCGNQLLDLLRIADAEFFPLGNVLPGFVSLHSNQKSENNICYAVKCRTVVGDSRLPLAATLGILACQRWDCTAEKYTC